MPFKQHLTQFKAYLLLVAMALLFGINNHYEQHKHEAQNGARVSMAMQGDAKTPMDGAQACSPEKRCKREPDFTFQVDGMARGAATAAGTIVIPVQAFGEAVLMNFYPELLGGMGLLWLIWFIWLRTLQVCHLKSWHDRALGQPPQKGQLFLLRRDLQTDRQWEEVIDEDFEESMEEFGPDDGKMLHLVEGSLLVLLLAIIDLVH